LKRLPLGHTVIHGGMTFIDFNNSLRCNLKINILNSNDG